MHNAGHIAFIFRFDRYDITPAALCDNCILQIFCAILCAQHRLQALAYKFVLFAYGAADTRQLGRCVVGNLGLRKDALVHTLDKPLVVKETARKAGDAFGTLLARQGGRMPRGLHHAANAQQLCGGEHRSGLQAFQFTADGGKRTQRVTGPPCQYGFGFLGFAHQQLRLRLIIRGRQLTRLLRPGRGERPFGKLLQYFVKFKRFRYFHNRDSIP